MDALNPSAGTDTETAWLVSGPVDARYAATPPGVAPLLLRVTDVTAGQPVNTVMLPIDERLAARLGAEACARRQGRALAPLFYLTPSPRGWHAYTQIRYAPTELLFISLGEVVLTGGPHEEAVARAWVAELAERHRAHTARLNNHQCFFAVHRPEEEIEHKFTLPANAEIWPLAVRLLETVLQGGLPGWIGEYRNEFEQWDFPNHLYEIRDPLAERGYVSFIPTADGRWILKRKWFTRDQPIRRERRDRGLLLPPDPDFPGEIVARCGVTPAWGGVFRRVRYDINVESLRSGHGYSVMFDRCTTVSEPAAVLQQCEVEYLRSRTLAPVDDAELLGEFGLLVGWVRGWLHEQGLRVVEDHRSKLSFLRDALGHAKVPRFTAGPEEPANGPTRTRPPLQPRST